MKVFAVPVIGNSEGVSYLEIILFVRYDFVTISLRFRGFGPFFKIKRSLRYFPLLADIPQRIS